MKQMSYFLFRKAKWTKRGKYSIHSMCETENATGGHIVHVTYLLLCLTKTHCKTFHVTCPASSKYPDWLGNCLLLMFIVWVQGQHCISNKQCICLFFYFGRWNIFSFFGFAFVLVKRMTCRFEFLLWPSTSQTRPEMISDSFQRLQ